MNDWKDLEIGNIPSDFFVNDRYEIEFKTFDMEEWSYTDFDEMPNRINVISNMQKHQEKIKYRYRLKPLEAIRTTRKMWRAYCNYMGYNVANLFDDGRPVEIIEE